MKSGLKMQELVERINELIAKVQSGQISQQELDAFVDATAALHHKAVILRYKSFENQIFGKNQPLLIEKNFDQPQSKIVEEENSPEPVQASPETTLEEETVIESKENPEEFLEAEEELTREHIEDEPTFDLFSLDLNADPEAMDEEPATAADEGQISAIEMEVERAEPEVAHSDEPEVKEEPVQQNFAHTDAQLHAIYQRIDRPDDSFASRFPINKIDNLGVAFGFNERLQTINDLFGGSSEIFDSAVREIEKATSKNDARKIVTRYAHQQHWNASDDLAVNFAKKVDQLYV